MISWKHLRQSKTASPNLSAGLLTLDNPAGWISPGSLTSAASQAEKLSAVYRCISVLCNDMGKIPVSVFNWNTMQDLPDHPLGKVLWQRPNEAMTPSVYKALLERNRLLRGNGFSYIHRDYHGEPVELIPMSAELSTVNLSSDGHVWYGYTDPRSGKQFALDAMDVLHYKHRSDDGLVGVTPLHYASMALATAAAKEAYDQAMYKNGGSPAGVLYTESDMALEVAQTGADGKPVKVRRRDIIRNEWERVHGGVGNSFRVAVLDNGLKYQPISVSNSDAQFLESKEFAVIEICRFFDVPPHKAYAGKQTYNSNEANSIDFITDTLQPIVTQYDEEDAWKLLTTDQQKAGQAILRNMDVSLRGDTASRAEYFRKMHEMGALSIDEIRRKERLPAVPGGHVHLASLNYVPLQLFEQLSLARNTPKEEKSE